MAGCVPALHGGRPRTAEQQQTRIDPDRRGKVAEYVILVTIGKTGAVYLLPGHHDDKPTVYKRIDAARRKADRINSKPTHWQEHAEVCRRIKGWLEKM